MLNEKRVFLDLSVSLKRELNSRGLRTPKSIKKVIEIQAGPRHAKDVICALELRTRNRCSCHLRWTRSARPIRWSRGELRERRRDDPRACSHFPRGAALSSHGGSRSWNNSSTCVLGTSSVLPRLSLTSTAAACPGPRPPRHCYTTCSVESVLRYQRKRTDA